MREVEAEGEAGASPAPRRGRQRGPPSVGRGRRRRAGPVPPSSPRSSALRCLSADRGWRARRGAAPALVGAVLRGQQAPGPGLAAPLQGRGSRAGPHISPAPGTASLSPPQTRPAEWGAPQSLRLRRGGPARPGPTAKATAQREPEPPPGPWGPSHRTQVVGGTQTRVPHRTDSPRLPNSRPWLGRNKGKQVPAGANLEGPPRAEGRPGG